MRLATSENAATNMTPTGGFSLKNSSKAFMLLSSQLYKNPIRAIVREICTNAIDAHIAAKKPTALFDVNLPTALRSVFSVRDYGLGLSEDDIENLFTVYFESTKSDSDEETGALGLGCKSPFGYTNNFTVISRHNGQKTIYSMYTIDHMPHYKKLSVEPCSEPTGLEVMVPVLDSDVKSFEHEANSVIPMLRVRPRLNGIDPSVAFAGVQMTPTANGQIQIVNKYKNATFVTTSTQYGVRQGGVVYPLDLKLLMSRVQSDESMDKELKDNVRLLVTYLEMIRPLTEGVVLCDVPMGYANFLPNREELSYDRHTVTKLAEFAVSATADFMAEAYALFHPKDPLTRLKAFAEHQVFSRVLALPEHHTLAQKLRPLVSTAVDEVNANWRKQVGLPDTIPVHVAERKDADPKRSRREINATITPRFMEFGTSSDRTARTHRSAQLPSGTWTSYSRPPIIAMDGRLEVEFYDFKGRSATRQRLEFVSGVYPKMVRDEFKLPAMTGAEIRRSIDEIQTLNDQLKASAALQRIAPASASVLPKTWQLHGGGSEVLSALNTAMQTVNAADPIWKVSSSYANFASYTYNAASNFAVDSAATIQTVIDSVRAAYCADHQYGFVPLEQFRFMHEQHQPHKLFVYDDGTVTELTAKKLIKKYLISVSGGALKHDIRVIHIRGNAPRDTLHKNLNSVFKTIEVPTTGPGVKTIAEIQDIVKKIRVAPKPQAPRLGLDDFGVMIWNNQSAYVRQVESCRLKELDPHKRQIYLVPGEYPGSSQKFEPSPMPSGASYPWFDNASSVGRFILQVKQLDEYIRLSDAGTPTDTINKALNNVTYDNEAIFLTSRRIAAGEKLGLKLPHFEKYIDQTIAKLKARPELLAAIRGCTWTGHDVKDDFSDRVAAAGLIKRLREMIKKTPGWDPVFVAEVDSWHATLEGIQMFSTILVRSKELVQLADRISTKVSEPSLQFGKWVAQYPLLTGVPRGNKYDAPEHVCAYTKYVISQRKV